MALAALLCLCPGAPGIEALAPRIEAQARAWRVPAALLVAVTKTETGCRPGQVSRRGAVGRWQILPGGSAAHPLRHMTAVELARDETNVYLAARHLARWHRTCRSWRSAVTIYHGGGRRCSSSSDGYTHEVLRWWRQATRARLT